MDSSFYTSCSVLVLGCNLYQDNMGTTPVIDGYYSDYTGCFAVSGGVITSVNSCTSGVTSYQYLVNASATNGFATQSPACSGNTIYPIWSSVSSISGITSGTTLYSDVNLTSVWVGQTEWYGIGTSYGGTPLSGYQITNLGVVTSIGTCTPSPTLYTSNFCCSWACDDTIHVPPGGSVTYIDEFGATQTESGLCGNIPVSITYQSIVSTHGPTGICT